MLFLFSFSSRFILARAALCLCIQQQQTIQAMEAKIEQLNTWRSSKEEFFSSFALKLSARVQPLEKAVRRMHLITASSHSSRADTGTPYFAAIATGAEARVANLRKSTSQRPPRSSTWTPQRCGLRVDCAVV
jgi:hypothetical protein